MHRIYYMTALKPYHHNIVTHVYTYIGIYRYMNTVTPTFLGNNIILNGYKWRVLQCNGFNHASHLPSYNHTYKHIVCERGRYSHTPSCELLLLLFPPCTYKHTVCRIGIKSKPFHQHIVTRTQSNPYCVSPIIIYTNILCVKVEHRVTPILC